jgi:hypothetical protein
MLITPAAAGWPRVDFHILDSREGLPSEIDLEDISKTDVDYASRRMAQGQLLRSRPLRAHCQVISLMSYLS